MYIASKEWLSMCVERRVRKRGNGGRAESNLGTISATGSRTKRRLEEGRAEPKGVLGGETSESIKKAKDAGKSSTKMPLSSYRGETERTDLAVNIIGERAVKRATRRMDEGNIKKMGHTRPEEEIT